MGTVAPAPSKTEKVVALVKSEIALVLGAAAAALSALQLLAVPVPSWAHVALVVATVVAASFGIRAQVSPNVDASP